MITNVYQRKDGRFEGRITVAELAVKGSIKPSLAELRMMS